MASPSVIALEITSRLAAAERVLASAAMVGDDQEHHLWRSSRDLWVAGTMRTIREHVAPGVAHSFERAVSLPPLEGSLAEDLPRELEAFRNGMAVLIGARAQLTGASSGPRSAGERRRRKRYGP